MERPQKLRRLAEWARLSCMSQVALSSALKHATAADLGVHVDRNDVREARDEEARLKTPFGSLHQVIKLPTATGPSTISIEVQHPLAMLHQASSINDSLAKLLKATADKSPPGLERPWRVVLYCDEVFPSNQLAYKSARKAWAIYWSILDWGAAALSDEVLYISDT